MSLPFGNMLLMACLLATVVITGCDFKLKSQQLTYKEDIKPIISRYCEECHLEGGVGYQTSGFLMDNYCNIMKGTNFGPVVTPGSAFSSSLYLLVAGKADPSIKMPHGEQNLSLQEISTIETWIDQGAFHD